MSIKLEGSTDGSVKLAAPADTSPTGTDVTLTLPTSAGSAGQYLRNSGTAGTLEFADGGKILQVKQDIADVEVVVTNQTYTDTGLSLAITPTSNTSKILIIVDQQCDFSRNGNDTGNGLKILRDTTTVYESMTNSIGPHEYYFYAAGTTVTNQYIRMHYVLMDSPATTSAVTYKVQGRNYTSGGQARYNRLSSTQAKSFLYLMEIAQ